MNEALNPSPDDSDTEAILITDGEIITLSKVQVNNSFNYLFLILFVKGFVFVYKF